MLTVVVSPNGKGGSFMDTLGQSELEWELGGEFEDELEGEFEEEGFVAGPYRGQSFGDGEFEDELEGELELEGEFEGEEFFRRIGGFIRRAAPILRQVAKVAAPMVGTAVGGPLGGILGRVASQALGEGEFEDEYEDEFAVEPEGEDEGPLTRRDATAELMAAVASQAQTDAEAEAMVGAATAVTLSRADRAALRKILPHLVRGTAVLTRLLRRRSATRPAVRVVPTIVRRASNNLAQRAAAGKPVTQRTAARAMAVQTRKVLSRPRTCAAALQRNAKAARAAARPPQRRPLSN
jgi:hypothetical protein